MTKKEKQLLRVSVAIIQNLLINADKNCSQYIDECICKHPEQYSIEFIKDTGFSKEKIKELLRIRKERLGK